MSNGTWLGPTTADGLVELGPIRIDRWRRQPQRTLLFGSQKNKNDEQRRIGPGLIARVALSKGHPESRTDGDTSLCAGVRLTLADGESLTTWYCPCDIRITLVGSGSSDLSRTVRWVMTPENNEIFFDMVPLTDVEKNFVSDSGTLRAKAHLFFHLCVNSQASRPLLPLGAHGATLRALLYSWCLADLSNVLADEADDARKASSKSSEDVRFLDVCRSGATEWVQPLRTSIALAMLPAPGLLPPCPDLPSAFAQEVIPGLMIASGQAMSKLVELHDVGVGTLLEVSLSGSDSEVCEVDSPRFDVRLLQLQGCGDTVDLVENPDGPPEALTALDTISLIEEALDGVLSGREGTAYMLIIPRDDDEDMEACAALIAVIVARCFSLKFPDSLRYVRTRWDIAFTEPWAQYLAFDEGLLPAESWGCSPNVGEPQPLLADATRALRQGDPEGKLLNFFASWFKVAAGHSASLASALSWDETWYPSPGLCIRVYDSGWGSASEVFRAISAAGETLQVPAVILRTMTALPKGEIFEVPYCIESDGDAWHLHGIVIASAVTGSRAQCRCFLHGASLWMLDIDNKLYEVSRPEHIGAARPGNWLCSNDMLPRAMVYVRNKRPKGKIAVAVDTVKGGRSQATCDDRAAETNADFLVRVVTEKMLQQTDGDFEGGSSIAASTVFTLPLDAGIQQLQERIHETMKIPPSKQMLLHLPESSLHRNIQYLSPLHEPLEAMEGAETSLSVLLIFVAEPLDLAMPGSPALEAPSASSSKIPILCRYFDRATLRYLVLGVLFASPSDYLLQHKDWVIKRTALVMGGLPDQKEKTNDILACSMEVGLRDFMPIRMDWPLYEQQVTFGSMLVFEASAYGRHALLPESKSLEDCSSNSTNLIASLAQLLQQPLPISLLGCVFFDGDIRAGRSKGRCSNETEVWGMFQRSICEAVEELAMELVSVSKSSHAQAETGSVIVFNIPLDGNMIVASDIARSVCSCFAAPDGGQRRALCQGRLAKFSPRELFITGGTAYGGARALWHAVAPNCSSASSAPGCHEIPSQLLSVLSSAGAPLGEVDIFEVGPDMKDGAEQYAAGRAEYHAASLLVEEAHLNPEQRPLPLSRRRRKALEREQRSQALPAATYKSEGDLNVVAGVGASDEPSDATLDIGEDFVQRAEGEDSGASSPVRICIPQSGLRSRVDSRAESESNAIVLPECRNFLACGICYEGERCGSAHPAGAQLARSEPCPFRCDSRDRCPLRICCAFAHGDAERLCPPYIRARMPASGSREHSVSSTPVPYTSTTVPQQQQSTVSGSVGGMGFVVGTDESSASAVKRMLCSTIDQLRALLTEAKALGMSDEIHSAEKHLIMFLMKGPGLPRREVAAPRSSAMSRSSSCDSFPEFRDVARMALATTMTPGEATQPSTPRSLVNTPGARASSEFRPWLDNETTEVGTESCALATSTALETPSLPTLPMQNSGLILAPTATTSGAMLPLEHTPSASPQASGPTLPIVSWREPMLEAGNSPGIAWVEDCSLSEPRIALDSSASDGDRHILKQPRLERRPSLMGFNSPSLTWYTSPWCISKTPNIRTPVSHCSPSRSPTSFSGYCSPSTGLASGVASPNQRRSRSGYSSPSAERTHVMPTFFAGNATQSWINRKLMSLREAREEKDDDGGLSSDEPTEKLGAEGKDLLDYLQEESESTSLSACRNVRNPSHLCLDLRADSLPYCRRGLTPGRTLHCLNAFVQALLPCAPLMHLFAQLSWRTLTKQRPTYACLVQIAFQFFSANRVPQTGGIVSARGTDDASNWAALLNDIPQGSQVTMSTPFDTNIYADPLLRRFERAKSMPVSAPPGAGPSETLARFVHFVFSELHNECKWPVLAPNATQYEDSPINRIFGGLLRKGQPASDGRGSLQRNSRMSDFGGLMDSDHSNIDPFLVLDLELTGEPCGSVAEAIQQLLRPESAHFARLPPFLLVHLCRFRTMNSVPTRISRYCHIDMRLELEEATNCTLRAVAYELCSAVCHYGEAPEGGTYKALARHSPGHSGIHRKSPERRGSAPPGLSSPHGTFNAGSGVSFNGTHGFFGSNVFNGSSTAGDWYVFDDTAVRLKPAEEQGAVVQCEGYHVCFLMYRREDTKTIDIRPHVM